MELFAAAIGTIAVIVPLWLVFQRVGLNPAWSLLTVIPALGLLIVLGILAHAEWPNMRARAASPAELP
jgi:hypothetical protein